MSVKTDPSLSINSVPGAALPVGPYCHSIRVGDLLYLSGALGMDPKTNKFVDGGVAAQAEQALQNLKTIVEASGSELGKVFKTNVFLASMNDYATINAVYANFFGTHRPARTCVQVAGLPVGALFEIECIASLS